MTFSSAFLSVTLAPYFSGQRRSRSHVAAFSATGPSSSEWALTLSKRAISPPTRERLTASENSEKGSAPSSPSCIQR